MTNDLAQGSVDMLGGNSRYRVRYADFFRAVGNYFDVASFRDLTLVETPDGFIITGHSLSSTARGLSVQPEAILFTDTDLDVLIEQAYARRGTTLPSEATQPSVAVGDERVRYEDVLRCIGEVIEERGWHDVVVVQASTGFFIKGRHANGTSDEFLDAPSLRSLLTQLQRQRRTDEPDPEPGKRRFWTR